MSLGSELRRAREERGVTQAEAAEHVRRALALDEFSAKTISAQETNRGLPTKEALAVLAAYYEVGEATAAAWETQRVTLRRARKTSRLRLRLQGIAAGAPGGGAPDPLFRPDDPAAEGVSVPDVPAAADRDERVAHLEREVRDLRGLLVEGFRRLGVTFGLVLVIGTGAARLAEAAPRPVVPIEAGAARHVKPDSRRRRQRRAARPGPWSRPRNACRIARLRRPACPSGRLAVER